MNNQRTLMATVGTVAIAMVLAACGSDGQSAGGSSSSSAASSTADGSAASGSDSSPASAEPSAGSSQPAAGQVVQLDFWGWAPGYSDAVTAFNAAHPDIQVTYTEVPPGSKGGYEKMLTAVKGGNAPCLGQVGYETLTSFVVQNALTDVSQFAAADKDKYTDAAWASVTVADKTYGAPVDVGPMGMFYNKELFDKLSIKPPTTWDEYYEAAKKIHEADPKAYISAPYFDYDFAGFSWQVGAPWFGIEGDSWKVTLDSAANKNLAQYWQKLVDEKLLSPTKMYDQGWYTGLGDGTVATVVGAAWMAGVIKGNVAAGDGKWAVAPMPQWNAGDGAVGNVGGSSTAVLAGCATPEAAWTFANWMSTDPTTFGALITKAGLYPAAKELTSAPELAAGDDYFGGQKIFEVFADAAANVNPDWTWGPVMTKTTADLNDALGKAYSGSGTIADALAAAAGKTKEEMTAQGMSVG